VRLHGLALAAVDQHKEVVVALAREFAPAPRAEQDDRGVFVRLDVLQPRAQVRQPLFG
jgi:hypothetical protein